MHAVADVECYHNYFLVNFTFEDGRVMEFERFNDKDYGDLGHICRVLMQERITVVTFNGWRYDIPLVSMALMGATNGLLKEASDAIIKSNRFPWELERKYRFNVLQVDHIDVINLLPLFQSLKLYSGRIGAPKMQDLPYEPHETIDEHKRAELREYCGNDTQNTWMLFIDRWEQVQLRIALGHQYNQDLRSKSDAQIAETVIKSEYERILDRKLVKPIDAGDVPTEVTYTAPAFLEFKTPRLRGLLFALQQWGFQLNNSGKPVAPAWLRNDSVCIDNREYAVGLGGLHSKNSCESYHMRAGFHIIDLDVTSYYPSIILNCGYQPPHMGDVFTRIFSDIVGQRIRAKREGDKVTADTLKITINGTFGKLGSRFSAIYAPELMLAVTFTGQLSLLMLIERLAQIGVQCVSANTDGVTLKVAEKQLIEMHQIVELWEEATGFEMEYTHYKSVHYRDVNNYFARTVDGDIKTKGIFKAPDVSKNPKTPVVAQAAMAYVLDGTPVEDTIQQCIDEGDPLPFVSIQTVKGGAAKDGEYLGKAVRWYYSLNTDSAIHYVSNGNKVASTDGAMPMMQLSDGVPKDLDINWYESEALDMIAEVGEDNDYAQTLPLV